MRRQLLARLEDADTIAAFVMAFVLAALGQFDVVESDLVLSGLLTVSALLAVALMRDRVDRDRIRGAVQALTAATAEERGSLRENSERVQALGTVVEASVSSATTMLEGIQTSLRSVDRALVDLKLVELANHDDVTRELAEARRQTSSWQFRGATGGFFRRTTLPDCVANARAVRHGTPASQLEVRVEILNPGIYYLCEQYANTLSHHSATPDLSLEPWTPERVQRELYATIYVAALNVSRHAFLDVHLGLSGVWRSQRTDIADSVAIITCDDIRISSQIIRGSSPLYARHRADLRESMNQAREVPVKHARDIRLRTVPTVDDVRGLFDEISCRLVDFYGDDLPDEAVLDIMRKAEQP